VDWRVAAIEHNNEAAVPRLLPAPLLAGHRGAKLLGHLRGFAAAQSVADWLADEGWPWPEDRAWAQRRAERSARRLAYAFARALVSQATADGD
jgi:hypothetical protein